MSPIHGSDDFGGPDPATEVATILTHLDHDRLDRAGLDRLFVLLHDELRRLAWGRLRTERVSHTLQPTALVHEAYLRLVKAANLPASSRARFLAIAARAMRQILIDHARRNGRQKRGGDRERVSFTDGVDPSGGEAFDLIDLHDSLARLGKLSPRMESIVEYRVFAGMTMQEIANALGVTRRTVQEDWRVASMWLRRELDVPLDRKAGNDPGPDPGR